jgi:hypothetical protein
MNDNYTGQSAIYAGMFAPPSVPELQPVAQGGTVRVLAEDVTASGFTLLTTAPAGRTIFNNQPHSGACWDEERQCLWTFGAETHGVVRDYDNSMFAFDLRDGLFKKMNDTTVGTSTYIINEEGHLWANDDETLPWAVHTYDRLHYDAQTRQIHIMMDGWFHASVTPIQKGSITLADRKFSLWIYDTVAKTWSIRWSPSIDSFNSINVHLFGAGYSDTHGWFGLSSNGLSGRRLTNDDQFIQVFLSGKINSRMHSQVFFMGDTAVIFSKDTTATGVLASFHPIDDLTNSYVKNIEEFPVLSGWVVTNKQAFPIDNTRFLFIAQNNSNQIGAFVYDITTHTITDTGHRIDGYTEGFGSYNFRGAWSKALNAAVLFFNWTSEPLRAYLLRL